jgi:hypothetical protein
MRSNAILVNEQHRLAYLAHHLAEHRKPAHLQGFLQKKRAAEAALETLDVEKP